MTTNSVRIKTDIACLIMWIRIGQGTMSFVIEINIVMPCFPHQENIYLKVMHWHLSRYSFRHEETTFFSVTEDEIGSGHFLENRSMQIDKDVGHVSSDTFCFLKAFLSALQGEV